MKNDDEQLWFQVVYTGLWLVLAGLILIALGWVVYFLGCFTFRVFQVAWHFTFPSSPLFN